MILGKNIPQNYNDLKLLYSHCIHFIEIQNKNLITLHASLVAFVKHIHNIFNDETIKINQLKDLVIKLLNDVDCYKNIERKMETNVKMICVLLDNTRKYEDCLHLAEALVNNFNKRFKKHVQFQENKNNFEISNQEIMGLFNEKLEE